MPEVRGLADGALSFTMPGKQKKDGKKSNRGGGTFIPSKWNAGLLIEAKKEAIIGNRKGAQELFRQYINRFPEDPVGYFELARLDAEQNIVDEAINMAVAACKLDPDNLWYSVFLAELYQGSSRPAEAINIYEKIVDKNPANYS